MKRLGAVGRNTVEADSLCKSFCFSVRTLVVPLMTGILASRYESICGLFNHCVGLHFIAYQSCLHDGSESAPWELSTPFHANTFSLTQLRLNDTT